MNSSDRDDRAGRGARVDAESQRVPSIRSVPLEDLPDIHPLLFRELEHRIAPTRLEHQPLPDDFLSCETDAGGSQLVFRGERYDLNITLFRPPRTSRPGVRGSGAFVVSNGAGVATNTVDQLSPCVPIAGMVDLKRDFSERKITAAFEMIRTLRPDLDALVVNMISGIARARDTAAAVERFCASVEGRIPVLLRFSGPRPEEGQRVLRALAQRLPAVSLADSTYDLVGRTRRLFGIPPDTAAGARLADRVESSLAARARLGVTLDPGASLTPDRTIEAVFGRKTSTSVGVLGFGRTARFQIASMLEHGVRIAWAVTPTAAKHADPGIPGFSVFPSVGAALAARGDVDIVLNYAPADRIADATRDCLDSPSRARLMILVAEDVPYANAIEVMDLLEARGTTCIGPNSPGVMVVGEREGEPDRFKLGNMPENLFTRAGGMSVVGRSGTVIFDIVEKAASAGLGTRLAWAIGGDRYTGLGFLESLVMLEQDPDTRYIVLNGEPGGIQEQLAARLVATGIVAKPVIALVTGESLPAGVQCGHQGAVKYAAADDPRVKERHLAAAGVIVASNPTEVVAIIQQIERVGWDLDRRRREALFEQLVDQGRITGLRWHRGLRPAYDLLYGIVGHFRIFDAQRRSADHLHELATHLAAVGVDRFAGLLETLIRPEAFEAAFEKSREYLAELVRGICETGIPPFTALVEDLFGQHAFNEALAATPWAPADLINEAHEVGIQEAQTAITKTIGVELFRQTLAGQPWNTAHAFRSINNMRWWRYVRAYDRYCTHLTGDSQLLKASWRRNPWASVKLVRGYDRMPEGELERALDDPACRTLFSEMSRRDPQGLLELGKRAFRVSRGSGEPFHAVYREVVREGVPEHPEVENEIERLGGDDFANLLDAVFTREAFERSYRLHPKSTARALRMINEMGDAHESGVRKLIGIYRKHLETFDTPSFRRGIARNLWMVTDLLRAAGRIDAISLDRIVDYAVSQATFNHAVAEHQWGTGQAFHKIADMGPERFLDTHRILEDVTRDRECFGASFKKNPRDAVEIVQVVANLGEEGLGQLLGDAESREAFLTRMRVCPRNAAHFLQEVAVMGVSAFDELAERALGRPLVGEMLRTHGCGLVHMLRRINIIGADDFGRGLEAWRNEDPTQALEPGNALDVVGLVKERALERRFSDPERRIPVTLEAQPTYRVSEGEIRGLHQSYPEWSDVVFKLHGGESMTNAERVDVYRLVSGRKRFQTHMVEILANFLPLRTIRARILAGEPLIRELRALRGVSQDPGHRFDVYFHTLEVLDQLVTSVLPLDFAPGTVRQRVRALLEDQIDNVARRDLLLLASALHDVGKTSWRADEAAGHVQRGIAAAEPILARFGLTAAQRELVLAVIRHHAPAKQRKPDEAWEDFVARGGLELLYDEITGHGENRFPVETILHYHADILGKRGDETPSSQIERRKQVTCFLLERYVREHDATSSRASESVAS